MKKFKYELIFFLVHEGVFMTLPTLVKTEKQYQDLLKGLQHDTHIVTTWGKFPIDDIMLMGVTEL